MTNELKLYLEGYSIAKLARSMKLAATTLSSRIHKERKELGIPERKVKKWRRIEVEEFLGDKDIVLELINSGMTASDIADKWEVDQSTVRDQLVRWGIHYVGKEKIPVYGLTELYKGWSEMPSEFIITVGKKPIFKVNRI